MSTARPSLCGQDPPPIHTALRHNLKALLDGTIAPRRFVAEFFELTEAGNLRSDIRKKLVLSLLLSENIRPSIKFLFLENLNRLPALTRSAIVSGLMDAIRCTMFR